MDPLFQKNQNGGFSFLKQAYSFRYKNQGQTFNLRILSLSTNSDPPPHSHDCDRDDDDASHDCENRHFFCYLSCASPYVSMTSLSCYAIDSTLTKSGKSGRLA